MKLTIAAPNGVFFNLEVEPYDTLESIKVLLEIQTEIPVKRQMIVFNNMWLQNDFMSLQQYQIKDNDLLQLQVKKAQTYEELAEELQQYYKSNPQQLQQLLHQNPDYAQAILSEDSLLLIEMLKQKDMEKKMQEMKNLQQIQQLNFDPLDPNAQQQIEKIIQEKNIEENLETAYENIPETFGHIVMLYIDVKVNNIKIQAFVDSGAQQTIMSERCAKACGLMRLLDKKFQGMAIGIGQSKILGRVHAAQLEIGSNFFMCSFTILEDNKIDMLLGLDMLRRHQCCIDLATNTLNLNKGQVFVPFLSEGEIKRDSVQQFKEDESFLEAQEKSFQEFQQITKNIQKPAQQPVQQPVQMPFQQPKPQQQQQQPQRQQNSNEQDIQKLINLGFTREQAIEALRQTGNVDEAASFLFNL